MIEIGLCTIAYQDWPLKKVLDTAGEIGFDGVEIWGKPNHMPAEYDADYVKQVCDWAAAAGTQVGVFGSYINPLMDNFEAGAAHCIKIAKGLGVRVVRIWAPKGRPGTLSEDDYRKAVEQQKVFCRRAGDEDLILAIETHDDYLCETSAATLKWLDDVGAENLKLNWQVSSRQHADDPLGNLAALLPHIVNVHAQNFGVPERERRFLAEGIVDYSRIIRELRQAGFDGYIEVEFVAGDGSVDALKKDFAYLQRLVT